MSWFGTSDSIRPSEPNIRLVWEPCECMVKLEPCNVSILAVEWVRRRLIGMFAGEAMVQKSIEHQMLGSVRQLLNQLLCCGLLRGERFGLYEVCGWLPGSDPKDYYRHFLGKV